MASVGAARRKVKRDATTMNVDTARHRCPPQAAGSRLHLPKRENLLMSDQKSTSNFRAFERPTLQAMQGYVPGAQPGPGAIKLNTNESAWPPGAAVGVALREIKAQDLWRYPDPLATNFRVTAARLHGVDPTQVMATNGGDELLRLIFTTFAEPGARVGLLSPGYGIYDIQAAIHAAEPVRVELEDDWSIPLDIAEQWNRAGVQLAIITNPHAPSGRLTDAIEIARIAGGFRGILLVDEAYVDFVDPDLKHDLIPLLAMYPNLVLLRSLSKGYGLAGLRLGYAVGSDPVIRPMMEKTRDSYNVDTVAQILGRAALEDQAHRRLIADHVRAERRHLGTMLEKLGFDVAPSQANFLFSDRPHGPESAEKLLHAMSEQNVWLRWFDTPRTRKGLRISIGTSEETEILMATLRDLVRGGY